MHKLAYGLALSLVTLNAMAAAPSVEEMWAVIQTQQAEIERLKQQVARADTQLAETSIQIEATADLVEDRLAPGGEGLVSSWADRTRIGGYGEMHHNDLDNDRIGAADKKQLDFHRFVLFVGHDFSERTRFFSEVELEHSLVEGGEDSGEIELEQAYVEHDLNADHRVKAGLFLLPVGLLNETHEPNTFYGVERNNVESNVVPTTWWEGGLALTGRLAPGLSYDAAFTSGLGLDAAEGKWKIRDGRQKVARADASDPAYTLRLKYTGIAGLELAASLQYQQDLYQGKFTDTVDAWLYEAHVAYQNGPFGLRVLTASWNIDDAIELIQPGADKQQGWYVEPSWRLAPKWGVFARYSEWDNQAGAGTDSEFTQWDLGFNYWLEENLAFKFDYQFQDAPAGADQLDGLNLGVGWSF